MSEIIEQAIDAIKTRLDGEDIDFGIKFQIEGEGSVVVDAQGVRAADDETALTLTADAGTFEDILNGIMDPTGAFMSGRLKIDGDMGLAMRLASILA